MSKTPDAQIIDTALGAVRTLRGDDLSISMKPYEMPENLPEWVAVRQEGKDGVWYLKLSTPTGDWSCDHMYFKDWERCFELRNYPNFASAGKANSHPEWNGDEDYLHICDLDEHIRMLLALRRAIRRAKRGDVLPACQHALKWTHVEGDKKTTGCQACGWSEETTTSRASVERDGMIG